LLVEARDDDTQVAVLVELKARFDEENNISWAEELERHGVHVAYGFAGLKTHCKATLVVRREPSGLRRYVHLSTGNYNATTARHYEDLGYLTAREDIGAGRSVDEAWRSFRLHFRRETAIKQQLQRWTAPALRGATAGLQTGALESRRRAEVAQAVAAHALFEIAHLSRGERPSAAGGGDRARGAPSPDKA